MRSSPQPSTRAASRYSSRDRQEELAQEEDRERVAEPVRDDQRPERADEVELRPHHVERHDRDLRRQHQRDEHDEEDGVAPAPAQPREGVRDRDAREEQAERRQGRVDERVERPAPERRLVEDVGEVAPLERLGPELRRERLLVRHQRRQRDEHDRREEQGRAPRSAGCGRRPRPGSGGGARPRGGLRRTAVADVRRRVTAWLPGSAPSGASSGGSRA